MDQGDGEVRLARSMAALDAAFPGSLPTLARRSNPLSGESMALLRYLERGVLGADFAHRLPDFFKDTGLRPPKTFDPKNPRKFVGTPGWAKVEVEFEDWVAGLAYLEATWSPLEAPSYLFLRDAELVASDTWLVHFSDSARSVAAQGFTRGFSDMGRVAHTRRPLSGAGPLVGWNFAFQPLSKHAERAALEGHYGASAVLFRSGGVEVWHAGDGERQVLFWGPLVKEFVLLERESERGPWVVRDRRTGRVLRRGKAEPVVEWAPVAEWVMDHWRQYGRSIVRRAGEGATEYEARRVVPRARQLLGMLSEVRATAVVRHGDGFVVRATVARAIGEGLAPPAIDGVPILVDVSAAPRGARS